jgi:hypothetical protein
MGKENDADEPVEDPAAADLGDTVTPGTQSVERLREDRAVSEEQGDDDSEDGDGGDGATLDATDGAGASGVTASNDDFEIPLESKSERGDGGAEDEITDEEKIANLQDRRDRLVRREEHLVNLDRLFLSDGLRLLIILPTVGTIFLFLSWFTGEVSPSWWMDSVEASLSLNFAQGMAFLGLVVLFGDMGILVITRQRYATTHAIFRIEGIRYRLEGRPLESMHGTSALMNHTSGVIQHRNLALILIAVAMACGCGAYLAGINTEFGKLAMLFATCISLMGLAHHLMRERKSYNVCERWGLLDAYSPPLHPATLDRVFTEVLTNHMDPLLASRFDSFLRDFHKALRPGLDRSFSQEKLFMLHHLYREGLIDTAQRKEKVLEFIRDEHFDGIVNHAWFDDELWNRLLRRAAERVPAFFRLVERLRHKIAAKLEDMRAQQLIVDVDMETVVFERANLFCLLFNNTGEEKRVVLRIQSPDFRPGDFSYTCRLKPGLNILSGKSELAGFDSADITDVISLMGDILGASLMLWQTLLPIHLGESTVSVRIEEPGGELIYGRQINVRVRSEYNRRLSAGTGILLLGFSLFGMAIGILGHWGLFFN